MGRADDKGQHKIDDEIVASIEAIRDEYKCCTARAVAALLNVTPAYIFQRCEAMRGTRVEWNKMAGSLHVIETEPVELGPGDGDEEDDGLMPDANAALTTETTSTVVSPAALRVAAGKKLRPPADEDEAAIKPVVEDEELTASILRARGNAKPVGVVDQNRLAAVLQRPDAEPRVRSQDVKKKPAAKKAGPAKKAAAKKAAART